MIRPAVADDAAAIAVLEGELFGDEAWSEGQVAEEITGYGRRGWVADPCVNEAEWPHLHRDQLPGSVTAYVLMRTIGDVSDLQRIGVAPPAQRRGQAARLLAAAVTGVAGDGAERVLLEVAEDNLAARAFYARMGFVEIDRRRNYYRHSVDALVLECALRPGSAAPAGHSGPAE